jgi:uncharacterized protein (DUF4213/DUF364 family)
MTASLLHDVTDRLRDRAAVATDPRVTVGDRVVLVETTGPDGSPAAGLAHRPGGAHADRADWPSSVAGLAGLAVAADADPLSRAVGVATCNALSAPAVAANWCVGDPMAAVAPDVDVVATVGFFRPALRKFDDVTVRVVERDLPSAVDAPPGVRVTVHPPAACADAFADADVCFVTGSTLIYGGVDRYLTALREAAVAPVVLVGATASHVPGPAFAAGVDLVAGARVSDPGRVRDGVAAGDCGTDLHDRGVEKVYATRSDVSNLRLTDEPTHDRATTDETRS